MATDEYQPRGRVQNLSHLLKARLSLASLNFEQGWEGDQYESEYTHARDMTYARAPHHDKDPHSFLSRSRTSPGPTSISSYTYDENDPFQRHPSRQSQHGYLQSDQTMRSPTLESLAKPKRKYTKKSSQAMSSDTPEPEMMVPTEEMMLQSDRGLILKTQIPKKGRPISKHASMPQSTPTLSSFGVLPASHPYFKAKASSTTHTDLSTLPDRQVVHRSSSQESFMTSPPFPANPQHHLVKPQEGYSLAPARRRPGRPPLASTLARHAHTLSQSSLQPGPFSVSRPYHLPPNAPSTPTQDQPLHSIQELLRKQPLSAPPNRGSQLPDVPLRMPKNRHSYPLPSQPRQQHHQPHGQPTFMASPLEYDDQNEYFEAQPHSAHAIGDQSSFAEGLPVGMNQRKRSSTGAEKRPMARVEEDDMEGELFQATGRRSYLDYDDDEDIDAKFAEGRSRKRISRTDSDISSQGYSGQPQEQTTDSTWRETSPRRRPHSIVVLPRGQSEMVQQRYWDSFQPHSNSLETDQELQEHRPVQGARVGRSMHGHARSLDISALHQPVKGRPPLLEHDPPFAPLRRTHAQEVPVAGKPMFSPRHGPPISSSTSPPPLTSASVHSGRRLGFGSRYVDCVTSSVPSVTSVPSIPSIPAIPSVLSRHPDSRSHRHLSFPPTSFISTTSRVAYPSPSLSSNASFPSPTTIQSPDRTNYPFSKQPGRDNIRDLREYGLQDSTGHRDPHYQRQQDDYQAESLTTKADRLSRTLSLPVYGARGLAAGINPSGSDPSSGLGARAKSGAISQPPYASSGKVLTKRTTRKGTGPFLKKHQILQQQLQQMQREHEEIEYKLALQQQQQKLFQQQSQQQAQHPQLAPQDPTLHFQLHQQQRQLQVLQQRQLELQQRQQRQEAELEKQYKRRQGPSQQGRPKDEGVRQLEYDHHPQQPQPGRPPKQRVLSRSESASSSTVQGLLHSPVFHPSPTQSKSSSSTSLISTQTPTRRRQVHHQPILLRPVVLPTSSVYDTACAGGDDLSSSSSSSQAKNRHSQLYHNVPPPGQPLYRSLHAPYLMSPSSLDFSAKTASSSPLSSPTTITSVSPTLTGRNMVVTPPTGQQQQQQQREQREIRRSWGSMGGLQEVTSGVQMRYEDEFDEALRPSNAQQQQQQQQQHSTPLRRSLSKGSVGRVMNNGTPGQRQATPFSSLPPTYHSHHRHTASLPSLHYYQQHAPTGHSPSRPGPTSLESLPEGSVTPQPPTPQGVSRSYHDTPGTTESRHSPFHMHDSPSHKSDERNHKQATMARSVRSMPTPSNSSTSLAPQTQYAPGMVTSAVVAGGMASASTSSSSSDESVQRFLVRTPPGDH
ncbi:MAG: hypothetical protein BYD32DRAFT_227756 [Podila humilis]|nr:MAG: hypothetical protein BYD32DRAFT_227756 [Podila humilis]